MKKGESKTILYSRRHFSVLAIQISLSKKSWYERKHKNEIWS